MPSVMYITDRAATFLYVCFGKVKRDARPDQLITFTRRLHDGLPIEYRELPSAALNQTRIFELSGSICDGWPLDS